MNKRAIWVIIGLMSAALFGIIILQGYWINWSYQLSENQFSKDVFTALNRVVYKLQQVEKWEEDRDIYKMTSGVTAIGVDLKEETLEKGETIPVDISFDQTYSLDSLEKQRKSIFNHLNQQQCQCPDCQQKQLEVYQAWEKARERLEYSKYMNPEAITERIDLKILDEAIRNELKNRNINLDFNYGIYSRTEKSFVINDGHYVVHDSNPQAYTAGWKNLYNSNYKVDLYPSEIKSPGLLMIHFPGKVGLFWGSLWKTLLGSIIFTSLILFCFAYTIQVIFFQKKVGEMKTDFINNMTHEFKTPIATISLAADSIMSPMVSGSVDKVKRFANIIKQENKRMNSQVEKVLQMALLDKKDFNLKLIDINIHDVIILAVNNTSLQVERKSGRIQTFLKAAKPIIQGDLTHVTNIVHNLLDNANKYSPDEPEIAVHTRDIPNGVEVIVEDHGIGISKETKKHIFDKFYRVHTGNRHDIKGFGLGLSYVKALITAHNGQIDVVTELGKGSKFILTLPHHVAK
ncbi:MAG: two-component system phosphate regulon sensor histidine kinase PhoR [Saprospiraceae bacterium]|jgi:two-component system phosphate regulon sensor histidine kinase PhoR